MSKIEKHKIGSFIEQVTGFPFESSKFNQKQDGIRLLRGINVTKGRLRFDFDNEMYYKDHEVDFSKFYLAENDIVISMDGSLVGRNYAMVNSEYLPLLLVQRVARLRANGIDLDQNYLYQFISSEYFIRYVDSVKTSSGIPHISSKQINEFEIPFFPLNEQKKIASILRDFDQAIKLTSELLLKMERRKIALMQKLLNGAIRFKDFKKGKWVELEIGELLSYEQPIKYLSEVKENLTNGIPVLTANKSFILGYTDDLEGVYENLPVIIFDDFTTDLKFVDFPFKVKSSAIKMLKPANKGINLRFVYEKMKMIRTNITDHKRRFISEYQYNIISVPPIDEQNKIASMLEYADIEIQKTKEQVEKLKRQKKGVMQQLLTGNIRVN